LDNIFYAKKKFYEYNGDFGLILELINCL